MYGLTTHERAVAELAPGDRVAWRPGLYRTVLRVDQADDETGHLIVHSAISSVASLPSFPAPAARYHPTAHVLVLEPAARQGVPA